MYRQYHPIFLNWSFHQLGFERHVSDSWAGFSCWDFWIYIQLQSGFASHTHDIIFHKQGRKFFLTDVDTPCHNSDTCIFRRVHYSGCVRCCSLTSGQQVRLVVYAISANFLYFCYIFHYQKFQTRLSLLYE